MPSPHPLRLLACLLLCAFAAAAEPAGFIHQEGTRLVDGTGKPVVLRAVNLGGWLEWEPWMWGGGLSLTTESDLLTRLGRIVGAPAAADFRQRVHEGFIGAQDFAAIAALGFNAVRVPVNHRLLQDADSPYADRPEGWAVLDGVIDLAQANGLSVIIDLSAAPGGQSRMFMADPEPLDLWHSPAKQERTVALWKAIAARYRTRTAVAGYDLLNEPAPPRGADLTDLYRRIIAGIRSVDRSHAVFLEGDGFATDFSMFTAPLDANQVYSFHMYTWLADNRAAQLQGYRALSRAQGVPLWCGEFGENTYPMIAGTVDLLSDPAQGVTGGWAFWSWKKTTRNTRYPALVSFVCTDAWGDLIDRLTAPLSNRTPSAAQARQGMEDFLRQTAYPRTTTDAEMVRALFGTRPVGSNG